MLHLALCLIWLYASLGLMPADLFIAFPHGGAFHVARALQHSILSILLLDAQHSLLELLFFIQLLCISEQIHLIDSFVLYDPDSGDSNPADGQRLIADLVEQPYCRSNDLAGQVGWIVQLRAAMCGFGYLPAVVVDVYRAGIKAFVAVFSVIAYGQHKPIGGQFLTEKLVG